VIENTRLARLFCRKRRDNFSINFFRNKLRIAKNGEILAGSVLAVGTMFLRVVRAPSGKTGVKHEYVRVVEAYRDHEGKTRHQTIINLSDCH
jgi:hypothetical protein